MQYGEIYKVQKEVILILNEIKRIPIGDYKVFFDNETCLIIQKYISYLIDNEVGHLVNDPEWFPPISLEWDFPATITNAIIEIDNKNRLMPFVIDQLNDLNCKAIEVRLLGGIDMSLINEILSLTATTGIQSIQLYINNLEEVSEKELIEVMKANPRLNHIALFSCKETKKTMIDDKYFITQNRGKLTTDRCGIIDQDFFSINIPCYTESLHHNSCLNRKIAIDVEGNIKNCPSMTESYGNIRDTTLAEAIEKPGFKKYWNINKDQIAVCKDCEFRYICTDCRAYVEDPHDTSGPDGTNLSKPLKCGYNPYTGEWAEWSTNPLKQKAIEFYGMQDLVKDP